MYPTLRPGYKRGVLEAIEFKVLTDDAISGMDEKDMLSYVKEALEIYWADYQEGFEVEWNEYKDREGVDNE